MTHKAKPTTEPAARLRQQAEARLEQQPAPAVPGDPHRLLHDLQVHQIELEIQNEELQRTQDALTIAQERYFDLYDLAPVGYFTVSATGVITAVNLAAGTLLGTTKGRLLQRLFAQSIAPADADDFHRYRQQLLHQPTARAIHAEPPLASGDLRMVQADGTLIWVQMHGALTTDAVGAPVLGLIVTDITARKQAEQALLTLAEKEVLLKEIHHRVKNNLQIISSLVSLQADNIPDEHCRAELVTVRDRVRAMAFVHEALYQTDNLEQLDFADYAGRLLRGLWDAHGGPPGPVQLHTALASVRFPVDQAVTCGLILNELATNAFKYAFPNGRAGTVTVTLEHNPATRAVCLRVQDDGIGLPPGLDWQQTHSLGLRLVQMLGSQLQAQVVIGPGPGLEIRLHFRLK